MKTWSNRYHGQESLIYHYKFFLQNLKDLIMQIFSCNRCNHLINITNNPDTKVAYISSKIYQKINQPTQRPAIKSAKLILAKRTEFTYLVKNDNPHYVNT